MEMTKKTAVEFCRDYYKDPFLPSQLTKEPELPEPPTPRRGPTEGKATSKAIGHHKGARKALKATGTCCSYMGYRSSDGWGPLCERTPQVKTTSGVAWHHHGCLNLTSCKICHMGVSQN